MDQNEVQPDERTPAMSAVPPSPPRIGFPRGFWQRTDFMLHHSDEIIAAIRQDRELGSLCRHFLLLALLMAGIYGAVMGATDLLQGADMAMGAKFAMIGVTLMKVPVLFLLTLGIVLPPIYVSNAFSGARLGFRQMGALFLGASAVTATLLASMATVAFFFALTSASYHFIKLLHVLFFGYAGVLGLGFFLQCLRGVRGPLERRTPLFLLMVWLALYVFVGTQLAWVLRPFVGSPNEPFQVFRPRSGNFYESVTHSLEVFLVGEDD